MRSVMVFMLTFRGLANTTSLMLGIVGAVRLLAVESNLTSLLTDCLRCIVSNFNKLGTKNSNFMSSPQSFTSSSSIYQ